ncbi:MAG: HepT-like ribonuclease domain-containing protein [Deltaproteobacteria bacterium]
MSEDEITVNLDLMVESIHLVQERFSKILEAADFVGSTEGVILLDAISMRLQIIDELVKKIQKAAPMYLSDYAEIEWKKISKFRDLVSHHYKHVDHEIVYDICKMHIPKLNEVVQKMRNSLLKSSPNCN